MLQIVLQSTGNNDSQPFHKIKGSKGAAGCDGEQNGHHLKLMLPAVVIIIREKILAVRGFNPRK